MINIDKLETLPYWEGNIQKIVSIYKDAYNTNKYEYKKGFTLFLKHYKLVEGIIKKYVNKPVNDAFSEYTHKMDQRFINTDYHYIFPEYLKNRYKSNTFITYDYKVLPRYYVDDEGIIRTNLTIKKNGR